MAMVRFSRSALVVVISLAILALFAMAGLFSENKVDGVGFIYLIIVGGGYAFIPLFIFQIALDFIVRKVFKIEKFSFINCLLVALTFSLILFAPYAIYEIFENPNLMHDEVISYFYDFTPFLVYIPIAAFVMSYLEGRTEINSDNEA